MTTIKRNKKHLHLIDGNYYTIEALMDKTGLSQRAIYYKMKSGVNTLVGLKSMYRKAYLIEGKRYTMKELMEITEKSQRSIYFRLDAGIRTLSGIISRPKYNEYPKQIIYRKPPNYQGSMFNDEHGHWKLLNHVLNKKEI
jgi:predicted DNA-binding transcriptional regulator AlpA